MEINFELVDVCTTNEGITGNFIDVDEVNETPDLYSIYEVYFKQDEQGKHKVISYSNEYFHLESTEQDEVFKELEKQMDEYEMRQRL